MTSSTDIVRADGRATDQLRPVKITRGWLDEAEGSVLVELTDDVLFAQVWTRPGLSPRDRSLVTITSLVTGGNLDKLKGHIQRGIDNGLTREEIIEAITHTAFYAGWPRAAKQPSNATQPPTTAMRRTSPRS